MLDLAPVVEGGTAAQAFENSRDLARHVESLGFHRFWLAEHHSMPGIASAATSIVIAHVAAATSTIRVGAGGIMLPNHSPLLIAEQFGTLETLFPGRIDLGLGRAPGSDPQTARALRRDPAAADMFPQDVAELIHYFREPSPDQKVRAIPGAGLDIPVWILGSSLFGAQLAGAFGLPFAFASHFAPRLLTEALAAYRASFRPSDRLAEPYAMLGISIIAADTDAEARRLFTSVQQSFVNLRRGEPVTLPPPRDDFERELTPHDRLALADTLSESIVGSPETVGRKVRALIQRTGANELMIASQIYDHSARRRSFEIVAGQRSAD
ncbi:MAG: LLM class flavin-dependent oxidoreductase [Gemmatimonadaceae bacterium]